MKQYKINQDEEAFTKEQLDELAESLEEIGFTEMTVEKAEAVRDAMREDGISE